MHGPKGTLATLENISHGCLDLSDKKGGVCLALTEEVSVRM